jgi:hypothetical protein
MSFVLNGVSRQMLGNYLKLGHGRFLPYVSSFTDLPITWCYIIWAGVGIAMDYRLVCRGSIPSRGKRVFSPSQRPDCLGPTQPPVQWVSETLSLAVKRPAREGDHFPPYSAEIKNGGAIPPFPIRLHGVMRYRNNFTVCIIWVVGSIVK